LGNVAEDYFEIMDVTVPNRFDLGNFFSFVRARIPAQLRINKAWKKSSGSKIYLGEWHTHHEVKPSPSLDDRQMIAKAFKETKMEIDFLYLIIVGLNGTYWVGKQTGNGLIKVDNFEIS
jgi:integrative and conjugative element protein (TIGR02256 family)